MNVFDKNTVIRELENELNKLKGSNPKIQSVKTKAYSSNRSSLIQSLLSKTVSRSTGKHDDRVHDFEVTIEFGSNHFKCLLGN